MIAVNQKAPHFITQYCLDRLRDKGRIVNIGSLGGRSALPPFAAYAATKRALQSLTMSTAVVVAPRGITCNLVAPGAVDRSEERRVGKRVSVLLDLGGCLILTTKKE